MRAQCAAMPSAIHAPFFAVLALNEQDSPMLLWLFVGGIMALGPVLHSYVRVYDWFKGKGIDTSSFVTRDELARVKAERDAQIATTFQSIQQDLDRIEKFLVDVSRDLPAIHRALGRLEGHDEVVSSIPR